MNMTRLWCIVLVACSGVAFAATDGQDLLDQYRKIYDASVTQYETDYRMAAQAWPIDYIRDLKALQTEQQSDGNLDGWERVNKELTRFRAEPTLAGIRSSLPELRSIQDTYRSNIEKFENEKRTKTEDLTEKYVARLEALQRDWTKDAKFDIAFAARDEIKRVEANRPATVEAEVEPSASEASKQTPKRSASSTETITHRDGTTVTPPGAPPPDKDGIRFSQKRLTTTDRSPWSTVIAIKLWDASETAKSSFEKDRFRGVVDAESKTDMRLARIGLQTTKSGSSGRDARLQVEYYAKPAGGSGSPRRVTTKTVPISYLDTRLIYIDLAPVAIESLSRTATTDWNRTHSRTDGDKFYGYKVTLLDANNQVLYEAVTESALREAATESEHNLVPRMKGPIKGSPRRRLGR